MDVILSTPLILEPGLWNVEVLDLDTAKDMVQAGTWDNFSGHQTVKALGIDPDTDRRVCSGYTRALAVKPNGRLDFGKEYSLEDILEIGVTVWLISRA